MELSENWTIAIFSLIGVTMISGAGYLIKSFLFSPKPNINLITQSDPVPNLKPTPEGLEPWVHFDTGARPAILRLENIGDARAVFRGVTLKWRNGKGEAVGAIVYESKRTDSRFEPYVLEPNTACTVQVSVPDSAFSSGNMLCFEFVGLKRPVKYKIPTHK